MVRDVRICFVGDSLVAGVGDRECLGWAGRLAVRATGAGYQLTHYNLGVRGQASTDIAERWEAECLPRLPEGADGRVVLSFGVNDTLLTDGLPRVTTERSLAVLTTMVHRIRELGWSALVVAPPPVSDAEHTARIEKLDERFAETCAQERVSYVRVHQPLQQNNVWMREVAGDDGYHPGAAGYEEFAALIVPPWLLWLSEPGSGLPTVR